MTFKIVIDHAVRPKSLRSIEITPLIHVFPNRDASFELLPNEQNGNNEYQETTRTQKRSTTINKSKPKWQATLKASKYQITCGRCLGMPIHGNLSGQTRILARYASTPPASTTLLSVIYLPGFPVNSDFISVHSILLEYIRIAILKAALMKL